MASNPRSQGEPAAHYREHLRAPLWCWAAMIGLTLLLAFALFVPLGPIAGIATLLAGAAMMMLLLQSTSVLVEVTNTELRVGRAHIPWQYTGLVATLDEEATTRARTVEADPRAFAVMRPLSTRKSVTIEILDDEDPHPYWLVSSNYPEELGRAIVTAQRHASTSATK